MLEFGGVHHVLRGYRAPDGRVTQPFFDEIRAEVRVPNVPHSSDYAYQKALPLALAGDGGEQHHHTARR
ncbi:hypothetical protein [Acidisphaera sp. S103]|uniref:hypothetical protein n=1 Tax=Acidisphaera sp. S103 TaxID=1747223 RepID=UPI00131CE757|nr:hypothetical protein [Acidisphaera sp. S103]